MSQSWASYALLVQEGCSFRVYSTTVPKSSNKIENVQNIKTGSSNWMYLSSLVVCVCMCVWKLLCTRVHVCVYMCVSTWLYTWVLLYSSTWIRKLKSWINNQMTHTCRARMMPNDVGARSKCGPWQPNAIGVFQRPQNDKALLSLSFKSNWLYYFLNSPNT